MYNHKCRSMLLTVQELRIKLCSYYCKKSTAVAPPVTVASPALPRGSSDSP
jgi:hypothetical protein